MQSIRRSIAELGFKRQDLLRDVVTSSLLRKGPQRNVFQRVKLGVSMSTVTAPTSVKRDKMADFEDVFPGLVREVTQSSKLADAPEVTKWLEKVLQYNCSGGKKNRGLATVTAYQLLEDPKNITAESLRQAAVMGWCVELLQSLLLMLDDVMDGSRLRRGSPCWYRLEHVGLSAVNDALLVQGALHTLLRNHFGRQRYYTHVLDTFNEILFHTSMGQHLDWTTAHGDRVDLASFTPERYASIIKYKTAYYTFLLPVRLAMYMAGKTSADAHQQAERICLKIGHFFQIQDDYLDCFGTYEEIGKDGTDIREGKCCWPAVTALQRCSESQRIIMETYYGSKDPAHEQIIRDLYEELGIKELYFEQELRGYEDIRDEIGALGPDMPKDLFVKLLDQIYKRKS